MKRKILFVDDEPKIRKAFQRTLRRSEYDVEVAENGADALAWLEREEFPVIVTDLRMPGIDGLTLMVRIRAIQPTSTFVVITGAPDLDLKADDRIDDAIASVIAKPWDDEELFKSLALAFELQSKRAGPKDDDGRFKLLLIEDDDTQVRHLQEALATIATITACDRLESALVQLREVAFTAVVTKLSLPDARGLDAVTRVLRARPETSVVVTSDIEDDELALQALRFGAEDYLFAKSMTPSDLVRAVRYARERKNVEKRLTELAHYDGLTGLANRMTLRDRLSVCLSKCRRYREECALLYIDLDFFKPINDTHGHEVGDLVLQQVSMRMRTAVREYDTVARLGGDEFAILIDECKNELPRTAAERVLALLREPLVLGDLTLHIGASGGLATFPAHADTIDGLVRAADKAMYVAKAKGRNCLHFYDPKHDVEVEADERSAQPGRR